MKFPYRKSKLSVVVYSAGSGNGVDDKPIIDAGSDSHHRPEASEPRGREYSGTSAPPKELAIFEKVFRENKDAMDILAGGPDTETLEFQVWAAKNNLVMV